MSFLEKIKTGFQRMVQGRYGADRLGQTLVYGALAVMIINIFANSLILNMLYAALLVWAIFRMFSRNVSARYNENIRFEQLFQKASLKTKQTAVRAKNLKKYKYYSCPKCKASLKLPRGVGEVTVTCGKCGEKFKQKA